MLSRQLARSFTPRFFARLVRHYSLRRAGLTQGTCSLKNQNQTRWIGSVNRFHFSMSKAESNNQKQENKREAKQKEKKVGTRKEEAKQEAASQEISEEQAISDLQEELVLKQEQIQELKEALEDKNAKEKELLKQIQYLAAERNNLVTRYKKQLTDAQVYAISKFAKDIVEVRDNLQRAMEIEVKKEDEHDIQKLEQYYKNLKEGVELTAKSLDAILKRNKIEVVNPEGQEFDPKMHDAIYMYPDKEKKDGKVGKVLRTGWKIGDRVLRSATVGVVKNVD